MAEQSHTLNDQSVQSKSNQNQVQGRRGAADRGHPALALRRAQVAPNSLTQTDVMQLQRTIGNRATGRLLQAKLKPGPAGDRYEQKADRTAQQVMHSLAAPAPPVQREERNDDMAMQAAPRTDRIRQVRRAYVAQVQTRPLAENISPIRRAFVAPANLLTVQREEDIEGITKAAPNHGLKGGDVEAGVAQAIERTQGGSSELDPQTRTDMEGAFGADFGRVRVHTSSQANTLNRSLKARAFTTGNDIFFGKGEYNPGSSQGKELLAHELTHTVQQGAAAMQRQPTGKLPFVQRKRDITATQTQEDFVANKGKRGDDAEDLDTLQVVLANYNKSLLSGMKVIKEGVKWYADDEEKQKKIETYGGTYQKVLDAGYKVFWFFPDDESVTICMTRGKAYEHLNSGEVDGYDHDDLFEDDQDYLYANTFNVIRGDFHASINYRKTDIETEQEENLPPALSNSEIIWFQHEIAKEAYRDKYGDETDLSSITSISREQIGNTQTLDTIFMADDDRATMKGATGTLDEPSEEAIALLGTPNGNSAVWLLVQHEDSGTVDIEQVEYEKNGLVIQYLR